MEWHSVMAMVIVEGMAAVLLRVEVRVQLRWPSLLLDSSITAGPGPRP